MRPSRHISQLKIYLVENVCVKIKAADKAIIAGTQKSRRIVLVERQTINWHPMYFEKPYPLVFVFQLVNIPKTCNQLKSN